MTSNPVSPEPTRTTISKILNLNLFNRPRSDWERLTISIRNYRPHPLERGGGGGGGQFSEQRDKGLANTEISSRVIGI